ncbi:hypothetical protein FXO37_35230 [Capsicum annuum]|nr:hypothetical protein FXO37_35230 [Capsicum annuum]
MDLKGYLEAIRSPRHRVEPGGLFPHEIREAKVEEFMNLRQGYMIVKEYCLKFNQLAKYAPELLSDFRAWSLIIDCTILSQCPTLRTKQEKWARTSNSRSQSSMVGRPSYLTYAKYGTTHPDEYLTQAINPVAQPGHPVSLQGASSITSSGHCQNWFYDFPSHQEHKSSPDVVTIMLCAFHLNVFVLLNPGSNISYVTPLIAVNFELYKVTIKNKYPIPRIDDLFDQVQGAGIHMDLQKNNAVKHWPRPITPSNIRSFLGLTGYYRRFVKGFSSIVAPLTKLTQKKVKFIWLDKCEKSFQELKDRLTSAPVLSLPKGLDGFMVYYDTSRVGLGYFKGSWDDYLPFIEFAYNNSYYVSIQMALFEALYRRRYRSPIGWLEVGEVTLIRIDSVLKVMEKVQLIRERLKTAQCLQKLYTDVRRRELRFEVDDWVFLKVLVLVSSSIIDHDITSCISIFGDFMGEWLNTPRGWKWRSFTKVTLPIAIYRNSSYGELVTSVKQSGDLDCASSNMVISYLIHLREKVDPTIINNDERVSLYMMDVDADGFRPILRINIVDRSFKGPMNLSLYPPRCQTVDNDLNNYKSDGDHPMNMEDDCVHIEEVSSDSQDVEKDCRTRSQPVYFFSNGTNFYYDQTFADKK